MGGGGGSTSTTQYQSPRKGVTRRRYGELSTNGFTSQAEYDAYKKGNYNAFGMKRDSAYGTVSLANGTDAEAAAKDWENYMLERQEIATYNAKEQRHKKSPEELSSGVTPDLTIGGDKSKKKDYPTVTQSYDMSPSTASTNQPLGIY